MQNNNWGGTIEDNSFGTHEFLNLCELLGAEPYISGNVGSGTVEELAKWVEYMTSDGDTPMANLRRKNGREKSWNVKYLGVGNESWGCDGQRGQSHEWIISTLPYRNRLERQQGISYEVLERRLLLDNR